MVSREFKRIYEVMKGLKKVGYTQTVEEHRMSLKRLTSTIRLEEDVEIAHIDVGTCPSEWISTRDSTEKKVVLYLHGGGFIAGSPETHRGIASRMARLLKGKTLLPDYRLAPEDPFPAGLEDCVNVFKWLVNVEKIPPENIIIAGDSAGGGLVISTILKLKEEGTKLPKMAICLSPWIDLTLTGDSFKNNAEIDPFLTPEHLISAAKWYCGENDPKQPLITPLYANLQGLPPIFVTVGTHELLHDDALKFAQKAKDAGVEVILKVYPDMIHVFQAFSTFFPEAREGIEDIGEFILKHGK